MGQGSSPPAGPRARSAGPEAACRPGPSRLAGTGDGGRPPFPGGKARATRDTGALAGPGAPISAGKFLLGAPVK